ncbi:hypothetical protein EPN52_09525 [bacterium]|nr:MAG: hypothetical protein EPN52_09525 [bacterium]
MSRSRLMLVLFLGGATALALAQARAAGTAAPAAAVTAAATATPTPGVSLDLSGIAATDVSGVWEVAHEENSGRTSYTHLRLHQKGTSLQGDWLATNGKAYPLGGSVDGNVMKLEIQGPSGTITVQAQLDPPANMVGLFLEPGGKRTVFTADNQAKYTPQPESTDNGEVSLPH